MREIVRRFLAYTLTCRLARVGPRELILNCSGLICLPPMLLTGMESRSMSFPLELMERSGGMLMSSMQLTLNAFHASSGGGMRSRSNGLLRFDIRRFDSQPTPYILPRFDLQPAPYIQPNFIPPTLWQTASRARDMLIAEDPAWLGDMERIASYSIDRLRETFMLPHGVRSQIYIYYEASRGNSGSPAA